MTRLRVAFVCAPLFAVSLAVVASMFRARRERPVYRPLLLAGVSILFWQLAYIWEILIENEALFRYAYNLTMPFAAFASLGGLLAVAHFYGLEEYLNRGVVAMMSVLPAVTAGIAFAGDPLGLLHSELRVITLEPLYHVERVRGVWFWAHAVYCFLLTGIALFQALSQHRRLPPAFRVGSSLVIAALLVCGATGLLSNFWLHNSPLSLNLVGGCIALVLLYVAMTNNRRMDYLFLARSRIFHHLEMAVFLLDAQRRLLECNRAAEDCLELWTGQRRAGSMEDVLDSLREQGAVFRPPVEGERGRDLYLNAQSASRVYNVRQEALRDGAGRLLGSLVTCSDVTQNRRLIAWLRQTAGTDPLTGLPNRGSLGLRREAFERDAALPLSVVVGDVNGLKAVNDTLGHRHGDDLLRVIGGALTCSCPPQGAVFRTGGDEFVILLPGTDEAAAHAWMDAVGRALAGIEGYPFRPSLAMGCATCHSRARSLEDLMHDADRTMYQNKKNPRA